MSVLGELDREDQLVGVALCDFGATVCGIDGGGQTAIAVEASDQVEGGGEKSLHG